MGQLHCLVGADLVEQRHTKPILWAGGDTIRSWKTTLTHRPSVVYKKY